MAHALDSPIAPAVKSLLTLRRDQLDDYGYDDLGELAHFIVVEPGDLLATVEQAVGFPLANNPPWEWVMDHGRLFEAPIVLSDDGFGTVLIVPEVTGVDPILLQLLRDNVTIQI
jgi:hypothetical protein